MEFDIGNLIYLIFAIIAAVVGLMGKKKKKPAKGGQGSGEDKASRPGFMENLEQVLKMGQEDPMLVDLQDYEPDMMSEETLEDRDNEEVTASSSLMAEYERLKARKPEYHSDIIMSDGQDSSGQLEVIDLDENEDTDYFEVVKDFDAGTAVVYSAIINRVDY